ncbi:MAG TPA: DUF1801 domain-containing protein [Actinomycetota bacterium]|nr:DUF1801 domain-containing protein [Actinomycetota bacterium]
MKPASADEYLAALPREKREVLERIRETVHAIAPDVEDGFGYGMPGFKLGGKGLLWYAAWKNHYSLYPLTEAMEAVLPKNGRYENNDKGTIRFPAGGAFPFDLVEQLVKARVAEVKGG